VSSQPCRIRFRGNESTRRRGAIYTITRLSSSANTVSHPACEAAPRGWGLIGEEVAEEIRTGLHTGPKPGRILPSDWRSFFDPTSRRISLDRPVFPVGTFPLSSQRVGARSLKGCSRVIERRSNCKACKDTATSLPDASARSINRHLRK